MVIVVVGTALADDYQPLSDKFIADIHKKASTWTAGRNFEPTPFKCIHRLLGVLPDSDEFRLPEKLHSIGDNNIQESFDSREQWPDCKMIWDVAVRVG